MRGRKLSSARERKLQRLRKSSEVSPSHDFAQFLVLSKICLPLLTICLVFSNFFFPNLKRSHGVLAKACYLAVSIFCQNFGKGREGWREAEVTGSSLSDWPGQRCTVCQGVQRWIPWRCFCVIVVIHFSGLTHIHYCNKNSSGSFLSVQKHNCKDVV